MDLEREYFNLGYIDRLSYRDTLIHRLDPRSKVAATMLYLTALISYPKYEIAGLVPLSLFPILIMTLGDIPFTFVARKLLFVSPFVLFVGAFNPFFERNEAMEIFGLQLSAGWISFASIIIRFSLSISAALLLLATTSFPMVCHALKRLKLPGIFTIQLVFLYRYIFVLIEEGLRIMMARDMRSFGNAGTGINVYIRLIGTLFARTVERAERINNAMLSRGFNGEIESVRRLHIGLRDTVFIILVITFIIVCRMYSIGEITGRMFYRFVS